jgi:methionyl-tRNA formyltransferase
MTQKNLQISKGNDLLSVVFFGTPEFAASILQDLLQHGTNIVAVVTQPDRPRGRSSAPAYSAVKSLISESFPKIPVFQPEKSSDPQFLEQLRSLKADLYVVVAFGQILPQKLLDLPPLGSINVHASLLPKYRGAAPIQRCLMAGDRETGVSIQKIVKQLDAGDVIAVAKTPIAFETTLGELKEWLCELSKPLLRSVLQSFEQGIPPAEPQDPTLSTYAPKIEPEEGEIDWTQPAEQIHNLIRAFSPKPGARCWVEQGGEKKQVKILRSKVVAQQGSPGQLLAERGVIACGQEALELIEVQPEGKKKMAAADWLRGFRSSPHFF